MSFLDHLRKKQEQAKQRNQEAQQKTPIGEKSLDDMTESELRFEKIKAETMRERMLADQARTEQTQGGRKRPLGSSIPKKTSRFK